MSTLQAKQSHAIVNSHVGTSDPISDLERRVAKMRELGVTRWGDIELGPIPQPEAADAGTQHESPDTIEQRRRADRRLIAMSASARLVPRLGDHKE